MALFRLCPKEFQCLFKIIILQSLLYESEGVYTENSMQEITFLIQQVYRLTVVIGQQFRQRLTGRNTLLPIRR